MIIWESYTKPWMHLKRDELPLFNLKFLRMFCDSLVATYAIVQSVVFLTTTFIWHHITDLWCNSNIYIFYHINFGPHISPHSVIWFDGGKNNFLWLFFFRANKVGFIIAIIYLFVLCDERGYQVKRDYWTGPQWLLSSKALACNWKKLILSTIYIYIYISF